MFDWFFNFLDQAAQNFVVRMILDHAQWVDWFALLFLVLGILYGIQQGLMAEIAEIIQIMFVIFLTFLSYETVEKFLAPYYAQMQLPVRFNDGISYILTGMVIWIAAGLLYKLLRKYFHTKAAKPLHYFGGAVLGACHLMIIFSFICQSVMLLPYRKAQMAFGKEASFTGSYVIDLAPRINQMFSVPLELMKPKESE